MRAILIFMELVIRGGILLAKILGVVAVVLLCFNPVIAELVVACIVVLGTLWHFWSAYRRKKKR